MRRRRPAPTIHLSIQSDVGFMILLYFMVTATFSDEYGVNEILPRWYEVTQTVRYPDELILDIVLSPQGKILLNDSAVDLSFLEDELMGWYLREAHNEAYHIRLLYPRSCPYAAYLSVKDAILHAHRSARRQLALNAYGVAFLKLDGKRKREIIKQLPLRLTEPTAIWSAEGESQCIVPLYRR